ncbi:hypothetical protein LEP1GSC096_3838 [Leptospira interrogans serovar Hebdomadis str. R499]|nr:hypothetical protein LEP1GSC096_3838 [Leptospira interrogans serovar Hebdomadis str. R499]EMO01972.1 hypothetical protein LEP1GSC112_2719 [Leptospira interrogans serovar Pomona str. UT364]
MNRLWASSKLKIHFIKIFKIKIYPKKSEYEFSFKNDFEKPIPV